MKRFIRKRIANLEQWANHPEHDAIEMADNCKSCIREVRQRAIRLGYPDVAKACRMRRNASAFEVLTAALAAVPRDVLSPPEIARELGVSADKVRGWCRTGRLTATNTGNGRPRWKVKRDDLDAFMESKQPEKPVKKRKPNPSGQYY